MAGLECADCNSVWGAVGPAVRYTGGAASEARWPSAHAACSRTTSCVRIASSTARSSPVPTFPSTTHALRCSIHYFARLMALPLNAAAYSAAPIMRISRAYARVPSRDPAS